MIVPSKTVDNEQTIDLSGLTEEQQENVLSTKKITVDGEEMYEVEFNEKYERKLFREQVRAEASQRIEKIADIIEKAQGQRWAEDKGKLADDIRNANK